MMYNELVTDCFFSPRHIGVIELIDPLVVYFKSSTNKQKISTELYLQCAKNGLIKNMCFKTNGNPYVIAALEWLCRQSEGRTIQELIPYRYQDLVDVLEIPTILYPLALHVDGIYKEVLALMNMKFERNNDD